MYLLRGCNNCTPLVFGYARPINEALGECHNKHILAADRRIICFFQYNNNLIGILAAGNGVLPIQPLLEADGAYNILQKVIKPNGLNYCR